MAISPPVITGFDQDDITSIAEHQGALLDFSRSVVVTDADSATFSGSLSTTVSGGGNFGRTQLDATTSGGRITVTGNWDTPGILIMDVRVDGHLIGSYGSWGGSNFSMSVNNATYEQVSVLIQNLRFVATSESMFSPTPLGPRTITVELTKFPGGTVKGSAQTTINVIGRPTLDGGNHSLDNQSADLSESQISGVLVSKLLADAGYADGDGDASAGTVISQNASTADQGAWQYSTDDGLTWHNVGAVAYSSGLVLANDALVRFVPADGFSGAVGQLTLFPIDDSDPSVIFTDGATRSELNVSQQMNMSPSMSIQSARWGVTIEPSTVKTPPTVQGDGTSPAFVENQAVVTLFENVTTSTEDVGQNFTGATFTVSNVADGSAETLWVGGTAVVLTGGAYGTLAQGGAFNVTVIGNTATVTVAGLALSDADMADWIEAIGYRNTSDVSTEGPRVISVVELKDSGNTDNTVTPNDLTATVTVEAVNDAPTFAPAGGGLFMQSFGGMNDLAMTVAVQPDGKVVVAGQHGTMTGQSFFALIRLNADGTLDTGFGENGQQILREVSALAQGHKVVVQDDGTLLMTGTDYATGAMLTVRLTADGERDGDFGTNGVALTNHPSYALEGHDLLVQPDGKILIVGEVRYDNNNETFAVARLNADGTPDTAFGTDGLFVLGTFSHMRDPRGIALDANGNILITGSRDVMPDEAFALVRITPTGQLDKSFVDPLTQYEGVVVFNAANGRESGQDLLVQADGKVVITGTAGDWPNEKVVAIRLNADGSLDETFGTFGRTIVESTGSGLTTYNLIAQPDGKLLLVGAAQPSSGHDLLVIRLEADGLLDTSFGDNGIVTFDTGGLDQGRDVAVLPDGKIVVVGYGGPDFFNKFLVLRLNADGSVDTTFSPTPGVNTLNGTPAFTEGETAVVLDASVGVFDAELSARGHYAGASVTLVREGGANAEDVFGASGQLAFTSGDATLDGVVIGTYTQGSGQLVITFNTNATQTRVDAALSAITYQNTSVTPPASVVVAWTFDDGAVAGEQGAGPAQQATGTTTVSITGVNAAPTLTDIGIVADQTEDTLVEIDFDALLALSDAADSDGSIVSFTVTGVVGGMLRLGTDAATAQAWSFANKTIDADTRVFWQPPSDGSGELPAFAVVAVDNEGKASDNAIQVRVDLDAVADRPVLFAGTDLTTIDEDVPSADVEDPSSNPPNWGDDINTLINASGYFDGDDDVVRGIAIAGDASDPLTEGRWQYSNDIDGALWHDIGPVSESAALLLSNGSITGHNTTYLRFVPAADYHGQPGALTVHVVDSSDATLGFTTWDGTSEVRHTVDVTASTAIAETGVAWNVTVAPVADAPVISHLGSDDDQTVPLSANWISVDIGTAVTVTDVDTTLITAGSVRVGFSSAHNAGDSLEIHDTDGILTFGNPMQQDNAVRIAGQQVGTLVNGNGPNTPLEIALTNATMADVALLLQHLQFATTSTVSGARVIQITVNDGEAETTTEVTITAQPLPKVDVELSADSFKAGDTLTVTFTLTDASADFTADDVTLNGGTLDDFAVDANNPLVYTATITPTADSDNLVVSVSVAAGVFTNAHGMANQASGNDTFAIGDTRAPEFDAVALPKNVASAITSADTIAFRVIFSEDVTGLDADDFVVTGGTTATVTNVASVDGTAWIITVSGGDLASFNGNVGLALAPTATVTDDAGNVLTDLVPETSVEYTLDNLTPVLAGVDRASVTQPAGDTSLTITLTLTETGSGIDPDSIGTGNITVSRADAFNLVVTDASWNAVTGEATYTVAAPSGGWDMAAHAGSYTVGILADQVFDRAGQALPGSLAVHAFDVIANLTPDIVSNGGGATASINHAENVFAVTTVSATDGDDDTLTYSIVEGDDADFFTIDAATGELRFKQAPSSANPVDADGDSVYEVVVQVSDGKGGITTQALSVSVLSDIDGDGIPNIEDTDADGDGLSDEAEAEVPNLVGGGKGDGNGDGISDGEQLNVASLPTLGSGAGTPNPWATIAVGDGLRLVDVTNSAAPGGLPRSVKMPAGQFGFTIEGLEVGGSTEVSFYIDASLRVNTYYKQNHVTGAWTNIAAATAIPGSDKVKLTFTLTDGGIFDADGVANGVIVDPGGAAILGPRIISHGGNVLASVQVQENARLVGTVKAELPPGQTALNYAITGGADAMRFTIDAATGVLRFVDAPDFERPVDEGADNVYDVQVTVRDQNEQSDTQLLSVQVLDVDETVPVDPGPVDPDPVDPDPVDSDDDGLPDSMENGVPGMVGGVRGDGNGDGIPDVEQSDVTSLTWQGTVGGQTRYVTLTNDAGLVQTSVSTATLDPARVPEKLSLPLGALAFTVTDVPDSGVVGFSIYVDADVPVNGYWKEVDGQWFNLATAITEVGGKTRIDFSIEDGGRFDADGERNGVIVDPGAPGWFDGNPYDTDGDWVPDLLEAGLGLTVGVKDNDVFERDDLFVMQAYRDFLHREAEAEGLLYWQGQLANASLTRAELIGQIQALTEYQDHTVAVARLYLGALDRLPDAAGLEHWVGDRQAGQTLAEIAEQFAQSPEFVSAYGALADDAFIDRIYQNVLDREADAVGKAYWLAELDGGATRGDILVNFTESAEFVAGSADALTVALTYVGMLGREADTAGFDYWMEQLADGGSADALPGTILPTAEYHDRFLTTDVTLAGASDDNAAVSW